MSEQGVRARLEGGGGEGAAQVGLVEGDGEEAVVCGVLDQPGQGQLVGRGQEDERVRVVVPAGRQVRMGDGELESGVDGLAGLRPRREISAGDDVQPGGALPVVHSGRWYPTIWRSLHPQVRYADLRMQRIRCPCS